jgi:hypothetical protein
MLTVRHNDPIKLPKQLDGMLPPYVTIVSKMIIARSITCGDEAASHNSHTTLHGENSQIQI